MPKVTFIEHNGTTRIVDVNEGTSIMDAAVSNLVPGIDGDCGGACACATCHVHVSPTWLPKLQAMGDLEKAMIENAADFDPSSRLACQIKMTADLDGIVVHTPLGQH